MHIAQLDELCLLNSVRLFQHLKCRSLFVFKKANACAAGKGKKVAKLKMGPDAMLGFHLITKRAGI